MIKTMNLKVKYMMVFLLIGLLPLLTNNLFATHRARQEITQQAYRSLNMYSNLTNTQLHHYFQQKESDIKVISTTKDVYGSLQLLAEEDWNTNSQRWQEQLKNLQGLGDVLIKEYGFAFIFLTSPEGIVVYSSRREVVGANLSSRDYLQGALLGNVTWSNLFYSDIIKENCMVIVSPVKSRGHEGTIIGVLGFLFDQQGIDQIVHEGITQLGETANAYLVDDTGLLLTNTVIGEYSQGAALTQRIQTKGVDLLARAIQGRDFRFYGSAGYQNDRGDPVLGSLEVTILGSNPVGLIVELQEDEALAGVIAMGNVMLLLIIISIVAIMLVSIGVSHNLSRPIEGLAKMAKRVATGDLRVKDPVVRKDEIGALASSFKQMVENLQAIILQVKDSAYTVTSVSSEIAEGNQDLSQRTEEQASALEETSATIQEIASSLHDISKHSTEGDGLSKKTMEIVQDGGLVMEEMEGAMLEITKASEEIAEISSTVNDIAFQTNLLALNAAVEAARAGVGGQGFSVVAAEVRNLAGRSAKSAQDIEYLIKGTIEKVERGNKLMLKNKEVLSTIVDNTQKTSNLVGEIAASIREKSIGADDIRKIIEELNQATQQNASLVEEIASSSNRLRSEALEMQDLVNQFKLEE